MSHILNALSQANQQNPQNSLWQAAIANKKPTPWVLILLVGNFLLVSSLLIWLLWPHHTSHQSHHDVNPANSAPALPSVSPPAVITPSPQIPIAKASESTSNSPLRLDIHVFSRQPDQRFVVIDGKTFHEGQIIRPGHRIQTITPKGVIIVHNQKATHLLTGQTL